MIPVISIPLFFLYIILPSYGLWHESEKKNMWTAAVPVFVLYSSECKLPYMYIMSSFIHQAQRITACCIYSAAQSCSRNELTDGHELEQKNNSSLSRPARQLPTATLYKDGAQVWNTYQ